MKRIGIAVLVSIFLASNLFAMSGVKRLKDRVVSSFKSEVKSEVDSKKKNLMKEFDEVRKTANTVTEMWEAYNQAKLDLQKARDNKADITEIVAHLLVISEWAKLLDRNDILSWQYNNIGWEFIKKFNEVTADGTKKVDKAKQYLTEGKRYLEIAKKLEEKLETGKDRKEAIDRNLKYIIAKELLFK